MFLSADLLKRYNALRKSPGQILEGYLKKIH